MITTVPHLLAEFGPTAFDDAADLARTGRGLRNNGELPALTICGIATATHLLNNNIASAVRLALIQMVGSLPDAIDTKTRVLTLALILDPFPVISNDNTTRQLSWPSLRLAFQCLGAAMLRFLNCLDVPGDPFTAGRETLVATIQMMFTEWNTPQQERVQ